MAFNLENIDHEVIKTAGRFKVQIQCNQCKEKYILRGSYNKDGHIDTGFKMCLCGNADDVEISRID